jgi:hypothetical protein
MGRGQTTEQDQFKSVLGARRGSEERQRQRDRSEALAGALRGMRALASDDDPLLAAFLLRLDRWAAMAEGEPVMAQELAAQISARLEREGGLQEAARSLGSPSPFLRPATYDILCASVAACLAQPITDVEDASARLGQARHVLAEAFEEDGPGDVGATSDPGLIRALADVAAKNDTEGGLELCRALFRPPTRRLAVLTPWRDDLIEALRSEKLLSVAAQMRGLAVEMIVKGGTVPEAERSLFMSPLHNAINGIFPSSPAGAAHHSQATAAGQC